MLGRPNGSGKSTALESIHLFRDDVGLPSWQRAGAAAWTVVAELPDGKRAARGKGADLPYRFNVFWLRPKIEVLRSPSSGGDLVGADGSHLASVLTNWKVSDDEQFLEVLEQLKKVVPSLENIRPQIKTVEEKTRFDLIFDFRSAPNVPVQAVSEGTLITLFLIAAVPQVGGRSPIILLDDIDRGLHPDAQLELIALLRQVADAKDLQIVMTTHSPFVVDALEPEEVCVLALNDTGTTRARMLNQIPGAERYRGMLSTGQLWSSHGESWVLEEQAKSKAS